MQAQPSSTHPVLQAMSALQFIPALSLLCLILSRTALHQTRWEDGVLGFGIGTLLAYVVADLTTRLLRGSMRGKHPELSDLEPLPLKR